MLLYRYRPRPNCSAAQTTAVSVPAGHAPSTALTVPQRECIEEAFPFCLLVSDAAEHAIVPAPAFAVALLSQRSPFEPAVIPATTPVPPPVPPTPTSPDWLTAVFSAILGGLVVITFIVLSRSPPSSAPAPEAVVVTSPPVLAQLPVESPTAAQTEKVNGGKGIDEKNAASPQGEKASGRKNGKGRPRTEVIGKLTVDVKTLLGHGSHGTIVYKVLKPVIINTTQAIYLIYV